MSALILLGETTAPHHTIHRNLRLQLLGLVNDLGEVLAVLWQDQARTKVAI